MYIFSSCKFLTGKGRALFNFGVDWPDEIFKAPLQYSTPNPGKFVGLQKPVVI